MGWVLQHAPHAPRCECASCAKFRDEGKTLPRAAKDGEPALRGDKEILMCLVLADIANRKNGYRVWASLETLGERCRCSRRTVERVLHSLENRGVVDGEHRKGQPTVYRLVTPDTVLSQGTYDKTNGDLRHSSVGGRTTKRSRTYDTAVSHKPYKPKNNHKGKGNFSLREEKNDEPDYDAGIIVNH